jgi:hypothetical protein
MNTLTYFQPENDEILMDNDFGSYSVWLTRENCLGTFPKQKIIELSKGDIEIPTFEDAIQIIIEDKIITEAIGEHSNLYYNSEYNEEESFNTHIVGIMSVSDFNTVLPAISEFLVANGYHCNIELEELSLRVNKMDIDTILSFEFID